MRYCYGLVLLSETPTSDGVEILLSLRVVA